jgi:cellulose synthase/poly-beta-1,6-N-acetylglucosamine synthase-like glycosyltransferase
METYPKVSIIVTCHNNADTIGECLQALLDQDYPKQAVEILVIDACSTDGTLEIAQKYAPKVESLQLNAPAAYNYAQKIAHSPVLGFVDSDAKVEHDWLKKLIPHLADPKAAGVSGGIETWNPQNPWARVIGYEIKNRYSRIGKYTSRIATMNLLLKKNILEEVGGWDENLPSQYDTDMGYRLTGKGYRFVYEPNAKCYHFNRQTIRAYWRQQLQYGKNTLKLYFKHGSLARGDEITDWGMNIQPALLLAVITLFLLGIVPQIRLLWYGSGTVFAAVLVYYTVSAAKISVKFHDAAGMRLVVLYFVRASAWLCGAALATARYIFNGRRKQH